MANSTSSNAIYFPEGDGYLLVKRLSSGTQGEVQLVRSVKDDSLCARKRYRPSEEETALYIDGMPLEVRISTYTKALPKYRFFNDLITWADYSETYGNGSCALVFKYINGGPINNFIDGIEVPEAFIWHCINEVGQAIAYLHLGYEKGKPLPENWNPIIHRDLDSCNILLDYPEDENEYPQPVLVDFGYAGYASDTVGRSFNAEEDEPPRPWEDIWMFGDLVFNLCRQHVHVNASIYHKPLAKSIDLMREEGLSEDLYKWLRAFMRRNSGKWGDMPPTKSIVQDLLPLAERKLSEFREKNELRVQDLGRPAPIESTPLFLDETHATTGISQLKPWKIVKAAPQVLSWNIDNMELQPEWSQEKPKVKKQKRVKCAGSTESQTVELESSTNADHPRKKPKLNQRGPKKKQLKSKNR